MGTSHSGPQAGIVRDTVSVVILAIATFTSLAVWVEPTPTWRLVPTPGSDREATEEDKHAEKPHDLGEVATAPEARETSQASAVDAASAAHPLDRSHLWDALVHLIDKSLTGFLIGREVYRDDDPRSVAA
jgi:hypothetical protein